jgi:2'-5' RNA ligase
MKATIVLLSDYKVQNFVRSIVVELDQRYQIGFFAALLPAHVSLKQPFSFESLKKLDDYFDDLATRIPPFKIELNGIYYSEWNGLGILGLNVVETSSLRTLHNQINAELVTVVKDPHAPHDGEDYRFHMTIELGKVVGKNPYRDYFEQIQDKNVRLSFVAKEIALFYYPNEDTNTFITYKVLPLTGKSSP